ncbi:MAG: DNA methyltransferase, partial [Crinalium sp.]
MPATHESIHQFLNFCQQYITGRERADAQIFLDRFFQAFSYPGLMEAGARCEEIVPDGSRKGNTGFADLFWERDRLGSVLIEMKSKNEKKLNQHYGQAWEYSRNLTPRPRYVILCNFDEFWIYDFEKIVDTPVDIIRLVDLPERLDAFTFMEFSTKRPTFRNEQIIEVTKRAAQRMGELFQKLKARSQKNNFTDLDAQRFVLQCVIAMFAQDRGMLPANLFTNCIQKCLDGDSSYDILYNGLFREMNTQGITPYGRYQGVDYFNGGLFSVIPQLHLYREELEYLEASAREDWSKIRPAIFGNIFESTVGEKTRHSGGIHFTSENDIMKIIRPTISKYWEDKIEQANTLKELNTLQLEMQSYRVLDPACGSGNFLYMAYQELKQSEQLLLDKIAEKSASSQLRIGFVTPKQFYGIDNNPFAVELARVTLIIARKVAIDKLGISENPLPLDTLDKNIVCQDALLTDWVKADAIIGNPPFQSKNKMQQEFGAAYVKKIREKYPEIPGRADYCVYWFRRTHDELASCGRAGLVGTNTIRQNYSREGGLDYIVANAGTITEAVSSQVWSGDAAVHVSIVNWVKDEYKGKKKLYTQIGDSLDSPWQVVELDYINSALSSGFDVTQAKKILANANSQACYQGQTHGHEGFLLTPEEAADFLKDKKLTSVVYPYLTGDNLLSNPQGLASRYAIDLNKCSDLSSARKYAQAFAHLQKYVMPAIQANAEEERRKTGKETGSRQTHFRRWWKYWRDRAEMIQKIESLPRYIVCSRVTKRPVFEFISSDIRPSDALQVFTLADDYSFGILQSSIHWVWFTARCSTLTERF